MAGIKETNGFEINKADQLWLINRHSTTGQGVPREASTIPEDIKRVEETQ